MGRREEREEKALRAFSEDLRLRIHEACQAGESTAAVAERFSVSTALVRRLKQRFRPSGSLAPRPGGRGRARQLTADEDTLRQAVRAQPAVTPAERRARLHLPASRVTVWPTLRRLRLTRKKKSSRAAEQDRPDVAAARRQWPQKGAGANPDDLVFLDEPGANTTRQRTHGYAPKGERVIATTPLGGLADGDLRRRTDGPRAAGAVGVAGSEEGRVVPGVCPAAPGAGAAAGDGGGEG